MEPTHVRSLSRASTTFTDVTSRYDDSCSAGDSGHSVTDSDMSLDHMLAATLQQAVREAAVLKARNAMLEKAMEDMIKEAANNMRAIQEHAKAEKAALKQQVIMANMRMRSAVSQAVKMENKLAEAQKREAEMASALSAAKRIRDALGEEKMKVARQLQQLRARVQDRAPANDKHDATPLETGCTKSGTPAEDDREADKQHMERCASEPCRDAWAISCERTLTPTEMSSEVPSPASEADCDLGDDKTTIEMGDDVDGDDSYEYDSNEESDYNAVVAHAYSPTPFMGCVTATTSVCKPVDPDLAAQLIAECGPVVEGETWRVVSSNSSSYNSASGSPKGSDGDGCDLFSGPDAELTPVAETDDDGLVSDSVLEDTNEASHSSRGPDVLLPRRTGVEGGTHPHVACGINVHALSKAVMLPGLLNKQRTGLRAVLMACVRPTL